MDVSENTENEKTADRILAEIASARQDRVVAFRGKSRWVQMFEPTRLESIELNTASNNGAQSVSPGYALRREGVYLIIGGLGDIGFQLARHFAETARACLVLTSDSQLPERKDWDQWSSDHGEKDEISLSIEKVKSLERLGSRVLVARADAWNQDQMRMAFQLAEKQLGPIDGVVHAESTPGRDLPRTIAGLEKQDCEPLFQDRILGLHALAKLVQDREPDFCMLVSSLSSVLGGPGSCALSAADLFMDAFVCMQHAADGPVYWTSMNWDGWNMEWAPDAMPPKTLAGLGMTREQGFDALSRVFAARPGSRVIISTGDLQARINQWSGIGSGDDGPAVEKLLHDRPNLETAFVAPRNETEREIAGIWRDLLRIREIGIHDNFFDLGGQSLMATRFLSRLTKIFGTRGNVSVRDMFETPTIAGIAELVGENNKAGDMDMDKLGQMLEYVEQLSDEDVAKMLESEGQSPAVNQ